MGRSARQREQWLSARPGPAAGRQPAACDECSWRCSLTSLLSASPDFLDRRRRSVLPVSLAYQAPCQAPAGPLAILRPIAVRPGATIETRVSEDTMATIKLLLLPGDGIGPEVMAEVKKLIAWMNKKGIAKFETEEGLVGGCAYDAHGVAVTDETMAKAMAADAVLFGAVGG